MSKTERLYGMFALGGEIILICGAIAWMLYREAASWIFSLGTVCFLLGRVLGPQGDWASSANTLYSVTLRRLYSIHLLGGIALLISAAAMWLGGGFHLGIFVSRAFWILPFTIFALIELYTVFRISSETSSL